MFLYDRLVLLSGDVILALAPLTLENCRATRYRAEEQAVHLSAFSEIDRGVVVSLYEVLGELVAVAGGGENDDPTALRDFLARRDPTVVLQQVRRLGADAHDPRLQEVIHDIRGGAMSALFVHIARLARGPSRADVARALFLCARDHMKMMRNVVDDLDPDARARDLAFRPHSLTDLARAIREFRSDSASGVLGVEVICNDEGVVAESCVECSALDRASYNLLNNAARYGEPPIHAWLLKLEHDLRVVIANGIAAAQRETLRVALDADPATLFGAFSTSGSGHGLRIVCELVGRAYGVPTTTTLVGEGYLGTKIVEDGFVSWFHWPLAGA